MVLSLKKTEKKKRNSLTVSLKVEYLHSHTHGPEILLHSPMTFICLYSRRHEQECS